MDDRPHACRPGPAPTGTLYRCPSCDAWWKAVCDRDRMLRWAPRGTTSTLADGTVHVHGWERLSGNQQRYMARKAKMVS